MVLGTLNFRMTDLCTFFPFFTGLFFLLLPFASRSCPPAVRLFLLFFVLTVFGLTITSAGSGGNSGEMISSSRQTNLTRSNGACLIVPISFKYVSTVPETPSLLSFLVNDSVRSPPLFSSRCERSRFRIQSEQLQMFIHNGQMNERESGSNSK